MTYTFENSSPEVIFDYLRQAKTVAVVGLSNREETSSFMVTQALQADGYRIFSSQSTTFGSGNTGRKSLWQTSRYS
jgi:predicted CoA-binding protein